MTSGLFVNDYSFHGQFSTPEDVVSAVRRLWSLREVCREHSVDCFCSRIFLGNRNAIGETSLRESVFKHPSVEAKRLVLAWIDKQGPYWDASRLHDEGDWYFAVQGDEEILVTDSAVAECAARVLLDQQNVGLLSATPSNFEFTPVIAGTRDDDETASSCELPNYWEEQPLKQFLSNVVSVSNWDELRSYAATRFAGLVFAQDAFAPIMSTPFSVGLRDRIITLLDTLNKISLEVDVDSGALSRDGERIREEFFVGEKALFTDSSDPEKQTFKTDMTFECPVLGVKKLFSWHGKAKMGYQYRVHFGWPKPDPKTGLPVVYIGPKITKR
jgi:hypothetical protein